jgi:hypothetical protein
MGSGCDFFLNFFYVNSGEDEDVNGRVICYNLTSGKQIPGHLAKTRYVETLCVSPGHSRFCG